MRNSWITLDTNQFIFGLRGSTHYPFCQELLYRHLPLLQVYVPLQVQQELTRNLTRLEVRQCFNLLRRSRSVVWSYEPAVPQQVAYWEEQGAKKGDARIVAQLQGAEVAYLISENRHFIQEIKGLPFAVVSSERAIELLTTPRESEDDS